MFVCMAGMRYMHGLAVGSSVVPRKNLLSYLLEYLLVYLVLSILHRFGLTPPPTPVPLDLGGCRSGIP